MRILIYLLLVSVLLSSSCEGNNKLLAKNKMPVAETVISKIEVKTGLILSIVQ